MVGKIIKLTEFEKNIIVAESEKNYNNNQIKITTYKKDFNDYISELYKKILILNKYRKINQNIIYFGCSFNISSNRNIDFPFIIPEKFEIDKIKIYFNCDKFRYTKIKSSEIQINKSSTLSNNGKDFYFKSDTFLKQPPQISEGEAPPEDYVENTDWKYLFLSRKSFSGGLSAGGAGLGQSFGVNNWELIKTSYDHNFLQGYAEKPAYEMTDEKRLNLETAIDESEGGKDYKLAHRHIYPFASLNHQHFLQPTAHNHSYQIPSHNHNYPSHKHQFTTPEHEHEFKFSHSHEVENEFYQSENIGNISIKINNNLIVDKKINGEAEFKNYLNSGINIINFVCSDKCFLNFSILANGRIKI